MAMEVETFEVIEPSDVLVEDKSECEQIITALGLEGQQSLMSGSTKEVCPYRKMTKEEYFVYHNLLTDICNFKRYSDGPIPLRVLQVLSHATQLEFFGEIVIWHSNNADVKDPVAVGIHKEGFDVYYYILARWGDALESLSELKKLALINYRAKCKECLETIRAKVESKMALLEKLSDEALSVSSEKFQPSFFD